MDFNQIAAVYNYLCNNTDDPQILLDRLNRGARQWDNPENTVLYLPMYSMGLNSGAATLRIEWLRGNGWDLGKLADAGAEGRKEISNSALASRKPFGMPKRIDELICRAQQIIGCADLGTVLTPPATWGCRELIWPFKFLRQFQGVGGAAALHILMELDWGVVKPDRHICRFLSRLGGPWSNYFSAAGAKTVAPEVRFFLVEAWRDAYQQLGVQVEQVEDEPSIRQRNGVQFPDILALKHRQIDSLIMWYTQKVPKADRGWRPDPICQDNPQCGVCHVPNCNGRQAPPPPHRPARHRKTS